MDSHGDSSLNTSDASLHPSESDTSLPPSETSLHPSDESDTNGNGSVIKEPAIDDQTLVEEIGRQYKIAESASNHVSAALKVHDDWRFEKVNWYIKYYMYLTYNTIICTNNFFYYLIKALDGSDTS